MQRGQLGSGVRRARRRPPAWAVAAVLAASAVALALPGAASSRTAAPDAVDRAATHAYLLAKYSYEQALVANSAASAAAEQALANKLADECPGVLAGVPSAEPLNGFVSEPPLGQDFKQAILLSRMRSEVGIALSMASQQPDRAASAALLIAVKQIHWQDRRVASLVAAGVAVQEISEALSPPDVCTDLRGWASTHFGALPPGTKQFAKEVRGALGGQLAAAAGLPLALRRYEGPREKALLRSTRQLQRRRIASILALEAVQERLERALGFPKERRARPGPPEGSVLLQRARTATGEKFSAWLEPKGSRGSGGCALGLDIETGEGRSGELAGLGGSRRDCLSLSDRPAAPSVDCEAGRLTVTDDALPAARVGRLQLSDGTLITSRLVFVPRRLGGPASYYYQVVRGPSPIPVSLAELDGRGRVLHVLMLAHIVECTKHPVKILPGGVRTIARGRVPGGPRFSIVGERTRFLGKVEFKLRARVSGEGGRGGGVLGAVSFSTGFLGGRPNRVFELESEGGCRPRLYAIVYGILTRPHDAVLVRSGGRLYALRHATIPASLHTAGVLAYAAVPEEPSELIVRAPNGRKVVRETYGSPGGQAKSCQQEVEEESEEL